MGNTKFICAIVLDNILYYPLVTNACQPPSYFYTVYISDNLLKLI